MMDMLQTIDVGLMVLDQEYNIVVWNSFMANHSGMRPENIINKNLFTAFPDIPEKWFRRKAESVFVLKSRAFTTWEQRPYLFRFKNYRPITGAADFMYQNITFNPLVSTDNSVNHIGVILYDVTDIAVNKLDLKTVNKKLELLSRTDRLTQLYNRGHWEECLNNEFARVQRTKQPATLIMFDIDHFKKVNDTHGHQAGDEVIRHTSAALRDSIRKTDVAGRYGGEEFAVILIDTTAENAHILAERLRKKIEESIVTHDGTEIRYTISLGLSEYRPEIKSYKSWLERADQALYDAKESGRNKSIIFAKAS